MNTFWARTVRGLEWIAAAEISGLQGIRSIRTDHRDLFFDLDGEWRDILTLRCVDDVYSLWTVLDGIDHTRASLQLLTEAIDRLSMDDLPRLSRHSRFFRVTASFRGRRNYTRFEIEEAIGNALSTRLNMRFIDSRAMCSTGNGPRIALWIRAHLAISRAVLGASLVGEPLHRRFWRVHTRPGILHPPVAAAMALLADLRSGYRVRDPFAGVGTLLIEAGLCCPQLYLEGSDIDPEAVAMAIEHAQKAGTAANFIVADASDPNDRCDSAHRILSNPPWGRTPLPSRSLAPRRIARALINCARPDGRIVIVADPNLNMNAAFGSLGLKPDLTTRIRLSGRLADIKVFGRGRAFADTVLGRRLAKTFKTAQHM